MNYKKKRIEVVKKETSNKCNNTKINTKSDKKMIQAVKIESIIKK